MANNLNSLILAAGKGTRMNSKLPKVLHKLNEKTMLEHVLDQSKLLKPKKVFILINKQMIFVKKLFPKENFLIQHPQLGTGHAVQVFLNKVKIKKSENSSKVLFFIINWFVRTYLILCTILITKDLNYLKK